MTKFQFNLPCPQGTDQETLIKKVSSLRTTSKPYREQSVLKLTAQVENSSAIWRQAIREINFAKFSYLVEEAIQPYRRIVSQSEIEDFQQEGFRLLWDLICVTDSFSDFEESASRSINSLLRSLRRANNQHYQIIAKLAQLDLQMVQSLDEKLENDELQNLFEKAFNNLSLKQVRVLKAIFGLEQSPTAHKKLATEEQISRQALWKLERKAYRKLSEDKDLRMLMS